MKKLVDFKVIDITADRLCDWMKAELSSSNPGMRELLSGEYLSVHADCVPPEQGNPYYYVVINGLLRDSESGKETDIPSFAWLEIRPLLDTCQQVIGVAYVYADMLEGWFEELKRRMKMVLNVEDFQEDGESNLLDANSIDKISVDGETKGGIDEQGSSIEIISGQGKQQHWKNLEFEITINTNISRFEIWLDRYRLQTTPFIAEMGDGKSLAIQGAPTFRKENKGLRYHNINAAISTPHPTRPDTEVHSYKFPVIELELFEPAENRLSVKVVCRQRQLLLYYLKMLQEIAKIWPETARAVFTYILQFIPEEERNRLNQARPGNTDGAVNTIADNLAGTIDYQQNEYGQTVIMGGIINPGHVISIGNKGVSIMYPSSVTSMQDNNHSVEISSPQIQPWEMITDHMWDRVALEMWHAGYSCREIGKKVVASPGRVTNRISELRQIFGSEIVPYDEQRKKNLIKRRDMT